MIHTRDLGKRFDGFEAVVGVSLAVEPGELLALLGPNGAGKTTTVRMLASLLRPTTGAAWVAGLNVVDQPAEVRRCVGLLTEQPGVYLRMRGIEYLVFFGELFGIDRAQVRRRATGWLESLDMADAADRRIGDYSKGMRQKLAIIRAMLHDPPVLMFDEPTSAMDPQSAKAVRDAILRLRDDRRTILLCTHNLAEAEAMADRIAIIRRGSIVAEGTPADLKRRLLGEPLMDVHVTRPLNGVLAELEDMVHLEGWGEFWFRYRAPDPQVINPGVLRRLAALGVDVVTLSEVPQSLEDVYLRVINAEDGMHP